MNLAALTEDVRMLPDQALQKELMQPSGLIPTYLVLGEVQRRQAMRQAAQAQQGQQSGSVYDDVIRNMMAKQPPQGQAPTPAGMTPPSSGPTPTPGATPPQNFKPPGMAEGGPTDDAIDEADELDPLITNLGQAIYRMEGMGPHTIATQQNNPGNLRSGPGQIDTANGYAVFPDMDTGFDALHKQIKKNIDRGLNLKEFFAGKPGVYAGYAPRADKNQPDVYAQNVANWTGIDPDMPLQNQLQSSKQPAPTNSKSWSPTGSDVADNKAAGWQPSGLGAVAPPIVPPPAGPPMVPLAPDAEAPATFSTTATAPLPPRGRIGQKVDQYQSLIDDTQKQLDNLPNPYSQENIQNTARTLLPALFGVPAEYLQNLSQVAQMRKATLEQLQANALRRYQTQSPWDYLTNLATGMAASRQISLPMMFAQGAGYASQLEQQNREKALADYDALAKESETIDNNLDMVRSRMGTAIGTVLDKQDAIAQTNRKTLGDQLSKLRVEQDKWATQLNPKNPFQVLSNPDDYDATAIQAARTEVQRLHPDWNSQRVAYEQRALSLLAQAQDPFDSTKYKSALDQLNDKHQDLAGQVTATTKAPAYTPQQLAMWAADVDKDPHALFSGGIPKAAIPAVQQALHDSGHAVPIMQPDKELAKQAALSTTALMHVNNVARYAADPWFQQNVIGPIEGRLQKGLGVSGFDVPGATPQQTRDVQDFLSSITYLFMREGKALFGGRPPERLMEELQRTTPGVQMAPARLMGALDAVRQSANIAIAADRAYMLGGTAARPIIAVPVGGQTGTDQKTGRKVMTPGPGQGWYYMDDGSEWKK